MNDTRTMPAVEPAPSRRERHRMSPAEARRARRQVVKREHRRPLVRAAGAVWRWAGSDAGRGAITITIALCLMYFLGAMSVAWVGYWLTGSVSMQWAAARLTAVSGALSLGLLVIGLSMTRGGR